MTSQDPERTSSLSRDAVVGLAVEIVAASGVARLSMRGLAAELGVTPMALYYHVGNKEELMALILQRVLRDTAPLAIGDDGWEVSLRNHLLERWRVLRAYPGLAGFIAERPTAGATTDLRREGVRFFTQIGFPDEVAELAWSFAMTYIFGRLATEARIDRSTAEEYGLGIRSARDHVDFGLDAVIVALRTMLAHPDLIERYRSAEQSRVHSEGR